MTAKDWDLLLEAMDTSIFGDFDPVPGSKFTGVMVCTSHPDDLCTCSTRIPDGAPFLVLGHLPLGTVSIYDAIIAEVDDLIYLQITQETFWHRANSREESWPSCALELAAGCGGMGMGVHFLKTSTKVAVDVNPLSTGHLRANNHGIVLQLNLLDPSAAKQIHSAFEGTPDVTLFGFPCQPFSEQGLRKGCHDHRFQVFLGGLRVIFLTQSRSAILECVEAAGHDETIAHILQHLCQALHWGQQSVILDLQQQWPCRRKRWWSLLMPLTWHVEPLEVWPQSQTFTNVGTLIKHWGTWTESEEMELQLSQTEYATYLDRRFGDDPRLLDLTAIAATILHSYGSALQACPCLCRAQAFSLQSLLLRSLRGQFVKSQATGNPRFLHPREVALLVGVLDSTSFIHRPREDLALLGLIASPIQTIWIFAALLRNFALSHGISGFPAPQEWLQAYQSELLKQSRPLFHDRPEGPLPSIRLTDNDGEEFYIFSASSFTVAQLLSAERINLAWNEAGGITADGLRLPLSRLMDFDSEPYALTVAKGSTARIQPEGLIMIAIVHGTQLEVVTLRPGQFLFEALVELQLPHIKFLVDAQGKIYGADFRIWHSIRLTTLSNDFWPPNRPAQIRGSGLSNDNLGLFDTHIQSALESLCLSIKEEHRPFILTPLECRDLLEGSWTFDLLQRISKAPHNHHRICCVFESKQHWALLWGEFQASEIAWYYCDGLSNSLEDQAGLLAGRLTCILPHSEWTIEPLHLIQQEAPHTCGTVALLHVGLCLGLFGIPTSEDVDVLHAWILSHNLGGRIVALGLTAEQIEKLEKLLVEHGVPANAAKDRAQLVISKLGPTSILEAFGAKNVWGYLKALASKPSIALRLVQVDELSKHVEVTAKKKFGVDIPNAKQKKRNDKKGFTNPITVDPDMLVLSESGFVDSEDDTVTQISFAEVEAQAHGIAICSLSQGLPYLKMTTAISTNPLALLVTEVPPAEVLEEFSITPMTFTATYKGTGEPMILYGAIKQLGEMIVKRVIPGQMVRPELIENQVVKITVYRDELPGQWSNLAAAPVKTLCQMIPALQLCEGKRCGSDCPKTHQPIDEKVDTILLEVWSRTFAKPEGQRIAAEEASVFWVFVRIPKFVVKALLQVNTPGIYFEPRSDDKGHDNDYRVIWLSARTLEEAQMACRTSIHALGLVRLKRKYGIRVEAEHEEATFRQLKPDVPYVATQVQRIWQLFPLPHGLQKAGVAKLLESISWVAKPLQPGKSSSTAMSWQVGSSTLPPRGVITAFDSEVLITELTKEQKPKPPPRFVASNRTQSHLRSEASSSSKAPEASPSVDPWLGNDPWKDWKGPTASSKPGAGKQHVADVAGQLRVEMQTAIRQELDNHNQAAVNSENLKEALAATDKRFKKLESTMTEVQAQNHQFHQWFGDMGAQVKATDANIQTIQYTLNTHQQELVGLQHGLQAVPSQVSQTMTAALAQQKQETACEINERFDRLEALLNKRKHSE